MRIVFMGSPQEVISPLERLLATGPEFQVVGVVSQPARPVGRSGKLKDPPIAEFAKSRGMHVMQPESARDPYFLDELRDLNVDVVITAAYGQILSRKFLAIPRRATINIHPSLLPRWRGATPVPATLLHGDPVCGVTILFTVKALDAGAIIVQESSEIHAGETAGDLTRRLFDLGGKLLPEALRKLADVSFKGTPQDEAEVTVCGKIEKLDGLVDWTRSAVEISQRFRAFHPWPGSFTWFQGRRVLIAAMNVIEHTDVTRIVSRVSANVPEGLDRLGKFAYDKATKQIIVRCGDGIVGVASVQVEGGKTMDAASFWNGIKDRTHCYFVGGAEA